MFPENEINTEELKASDKSVEIDQSQSDISLCDASQQPTLQPSKPTARSVETLTNQMVFSIIGEVTRRNSADLLEGASTMPQAAQDTPTSLAPVHHKYVL